MTFSVLALMSHSFQVIYCNLHNCFNMQCKKRGGEELKGEKTFKRQFRKPSIKIIIACFLRFVILHQIGKKKHIEGKGPLGRKLKKIPALAQGLVQGFSP